VLVPISLRCRDNNDGPIGERFTFAEEVLGNPTSALQRTDSARRAKEERALACLEESRGHLASASSGS
jgi:hypothetical protein